MTISLAVDTGGWVDAAVALPSPNADQRPAGVSPSLLVVHNISLPPGQFDGDAVAALFQNRLDFDSHPAYARIRDLRVSAHFFIRRTGELQQFVSCDARAWHAGESSFFGRRHCNDFSIGIELEGVDTQSFAAAQYTMLASLVRALAQHYPIDSMAGHSDIAPSRKTDPGPCFDWQRLQSALGFSDQYFPYRL